MRSLVGLCDPFVLFSGALSQPRIQRLSGGLCALPGPNTVGTAGSIRVASAGWHHRPEWLHYPDSTLVLDGGVGGGARPGIL